ncbi:hypothetical protein FCF10_00300 [Lactobacillus amylovorus subsp. animalium]|uniref:hypothetical protein n=1 Tax=Lactobacillus amylovorus TaxID=1604 RepID=UPI0010AB9D72|nr:hypothetical protein [Lactobacillus amylovorus]MDB6248848.1 hypothetical protein [Lactobacillus amylovorus]TJY06651.1 hypothetical protein FCF10_00300 [Lactobacillus amylovorus]
MVENINPKFQKISAQVKGNGVNEEENYKPSTFAPIRDSKTAPVQSQLDKMLPIVIGHSFLLIDVEEQQNTDSKSGELQIASIYTVRIISHKARAFRDLIQIKVKNEHPIVNNEELDKLMLQQTKPIIIRFDDVAHYAYMGGETLNASKAERVNISIREAMDHE